MSAQPLTLSPRTIKRNCLLYPSDGANQPHGVRGRGFVTPAQSRGRKADARARGLAGRRHNSAAWERVFEGYLSEGRGVADLGGAACGREGHTWRQYVSSRARLGNDKYCGAFVELKQKSWPEK